MRRRDFLRMTAGVLGAALVNPTMLHANESGWIDSWWNTENIDGEALPAVVKPILTVATGQFCEGRLRLKSPIHGEGYEFKFRDTSGNYDSRELAALNWFLRCRDGSWQYMDIRTIESLNYLSALFGVPEIIINSGYRSPAYNKQLAQKNENVARNSLHQYGRAIDYSIPGIPIKEVCSYTLYARNTMGYGGVGYYPRSNFVHLDSGPIKQWIR